MEDAPTPCCEEINVKLTLVPGLAGLCLLLSSAAVFAAEPPLAAAIDADPAIPTLRRVVGHEWGQNVSSYAEMERYLRALVRAASDRAALVPYGKTYEGRTLYQVIITSPENFARREEIRAENLKLAADPTAPAAPNLPAIACLAFGVHGNETSSTEAAMLTAYHLLADRGAATREMLANVVVILDPLQNPDGHERFVNVFRETRGVFPDAQPLAVEHQERWPGGRSNHYLFDMNRDWFLQSQRESRGRVSAYLAWQPHLLVDAHEMGYDNTYFFDPPTDPVNPLVLPLQMRWLDRIGRHLGARFDEEGFAYTTREMFDSFYPGYGSTWPLFQGGLGILWEQAGVRGVVIKRQDELLLRLADAARHHYTSAMATIEFCAQHREGLVDAFRESRRRGVQLGEDGPVRHFFLPLDRPDRAEPLARLLRDNGVEVRRTAKPLSVECTSVLSGEKSRRTVAANSFHIPVAQPAGMLVRTLLDRQADMPKEFVERQLQRNQERFPDEIYDVTAWSVPLAWNAECLAAESAEEVAGDLWDGASTPASIAGGPAKVAYLIPDQDQVTSVLPGWLRKGLRVRVSGRSFRLDERDFPRGTLIVRTNENPSDLHSVMEATARERGLTVVAANSGLVSEGAQLGGPYVQWVRPPRVLLALDRPASYSVGHTWYLFDQAWKYPTTRVSMANLGRVDLSKFNVLILPDGDYGSTSPFAESDANRFRSWVTQGGTLILVKRAAAWATNEKVALLSAKLQKKVATPPAKEAATTEKPPADQATENPDSVPGAFLGADVFQEHWLTFGFGKTAPFFFNGSTILAPPALSKGRSLVTFHPEEKLVTSGFVWPETRKLLAGSSYLVHEPLGQGHVVAFAEDPNFRAMYPAAQRLFFNAVFFGPGH